MNLSSDILLQSFKKWLNTLGYAESTVYTSVNFVRDFFFYLRTTEITNLEAIQVVAINSYYKHLQTRPHKRKPGSLSSNTITSNINAIKRYSRYLQVTGKPFFEVPIKTKPDKETPKTTLSLNEIKTLYTACSNDAKGMRDRAMLSIYYGCGLRRSEGANLNVKDVLLKEKLLFVRTGKGYKERYVPMGEAVKGDIENYLYHARQSLLNGLNTHQESFFVSYRGTRMCGVSLMQRLHKLANKAQINKSVGLHTLRHSIATHLLQSGMTLEEVSRFLGHSSLESTQIYTHLVNEIIY